jgi:hypothetical protein
MQDRPTTAELLDAVREFLAAEILPIAEPAAGGLAFRVRVAMNLLRLAGRDLALGRELMDAEWRRLNRLLGMAAPPPTPDAALRQALLARRGALATRIRAGWDAPELRAALSDGLREQLRIANPIYLEEFEPV